MLDPVMRKLIAAAQVARADAIAPYSQFLVGAALETLDGAIYGGCNIENASYSLTVCAERVAAFKAISDGARGFARIAVVTDTDTLTPPCGACRQVLWELCGDLEVILANHDGRHETMKLSELLPRPFDASFL